MRPTMLALLASIAMVSATGCAQTDIDKLISRVSCSTSKSTARCLRTKSELSDLKEIEECLMVGGCSEEDAMSGAGQFVIACRGGFAREGLRRRQDDDEDSTTSEEPTTTTDAPITTKKTAKSTTTTTSAKTTAKSTTAPSTTDAKTTSHTSSSITESSSSSSSQSTPSSSTSTTSSSTSSSTDSSSSSTIITSSVSQTTPLICYTTTTKPTTVCDVTNFSTFSCHPTTTEISSCAPGMICFNNVPAGSNHCIKTDNRLDTSGIVVAIIFALGLVITFVIVIAMVMRSKKQLKQMRQAQLLNAANARSGRRDVEAAQTFQKAGASAADLPLIPPGGMRSDQQSYGGQEYGGSQQTERRPAPPAPQLNQGLAALGQNPRY